MRRSYFTHAEVIPYLCEPIRALYEHETELSSPEKPDWQPILDANDVPAIEAVIVPEEDRIIQLGFSCVKGRNMALLPIVAAFLQYSLVQRANQQLAVPYSQITQSYHDAVEFLRSNKTLCNSSAQSASMLIKSKAFRRRMT